VWAAVVNPDPPAARKPRRHPAAALVIIAALVTAALVTVAALNHWQAGRDATAEQAARVEELRAAAARRAELRVADLERQLAAVNAKVEADRNRKAAEDAAAARAMAARAAAARAAEELWEGIQADAKNLAPNELAGARLHAETLGVRDTIGRTFIYAGYHRLGGSANSLEAMVRANNTAVLLLQKLDQRAAYAIYHNHASPDLYRDEWTEAFYKFSPSDQQYLRDNWLLFPVLAHLRAPAAAPARSP
jgi:hypothetical protein